MRGRDLLVVVLMVGVVTACDSGLVRREITHPDMAPLRFDTAPRRDRGVRLDGGGVPDVPVAPQDEGVSVDLPTQHLDPCLTGKCGAGMICVANICHKTCHQPDERCNDKVPECGEGEACVQASSFAEACFPADPEGADCGQDGFCAAGTLCVNTGQYVRCLKLCKYGCAGGKCASTDNHCSVCLQ